MKKTPKNQKIAKVFHFSADVLTILVQLRTLIPQRSVFMAISSISGSAPGQPSARAKTVVAQENEDLNTMKPGLSNNDFAPSEDEKKMEAVKGVEKVDTVI
jgi:hypothetical protein